MHQFTCSGLKAVSYNDNTDRDQHVAGRTVDWGDIVDLLVMKAQADTMVYEQEKS